MSSSPPTPPVIVVASRRAAPATLAAKHPGATIVDVTSRAPAPWVRLSPFFPHGEIPIPFSPGQVGASVEGIWQGLKVFAAVDVDPAAFANTTMKGLKRTVRRFGPCRGHREGVAGERLLGYGEARRAIYVPTYRWVLAHRLGAELGELAAIAGRGPLVLLDYETNVDVYDLRRPLSHAGLVAAWLREGLAL